MAAVLKAETIVDMIVEDVRHGAILRTYEIEPYHCVLFVREQNARLGDVMQDALGEKYVDDARFASKLDAICERVMNAKESMDDMCDLRDMLRAAVIDLCSRWARKLAEDRL